MTSDTIATQVTPHALSPNRIIGILLTLANYRVKPFSPAPYPGVPYSSLKSLVKQTRLLCGRAATGIRGSWGATGSNHALVALAVLGLVFLPARARAADPRFWEAVTLEGEALDAVLGVPPDRLSALRCGPSGCVPIPVQVDERDAAGRWVLDRGAPAGADDQPDLIDSNDAVLVMASDAGERADPRAIRTDADRLVEVRLDDPLGFPPRWVYLVVSTAAAPVPAAYVDYDPGADLIRGHAVAMGFSGGVPRHLALSPGGVDILDRLKIRATVTLLFGLLRIGRGEGDLIPEAVSWRAGPLRVLRRQPYTIRLGFGIRSPGFVSDTLFYRDYAEMPVTVRLRVPPRYIFTGIGVRAALDFVDLSRGWSVVAPGLRDPLPVDCDSRRETDTIDGTPGEWFALRGEQATLVERLQRGPSLRSVRQRLWYRAGRRLDDPPEDHPGQCPGIGFELHDWDGVEGGRHVLSSISYALPPDVDLDEFLAAVAAPLQPRARLIENRAPR